MLSLFCELLKVLVWELTALGSQSKVGWEEFSLLLWDIDYFCCILYYYLEVFVTGLK